MFQANYLSHSLSIFLPLSLSSSHYFIVIATGDKPLVNITTIYRFSDPLWRDLGYYATAAITADNDNTTFTIGNSVYTTYNSLDYFNAPLNEDTQYRVFIRLYSSVNNPVCQHTHIHVHVHVH